jgi:hypothetical protein
MLKFVHRAFFNIQEAIIIFLLVLTFNNVLGRFEVVIKSDGVGYYDYNPSIFIHHDLIRNSSDSIHNPDLLNRVRAIGNHIYVDYQGRPLNKYAVGTSVLQLPFFLFAYTVSGANSTGYEQIYQDSIFASGLFYLFCSLLLIRLLLISIKINRWIIFISQILLVFATSITHYTNEESSFSHIYSLFAITLFLFFVHRFIRNQNPKDIYLTAIALGIVVLTRQINGLIVFSVPFIAGSRQVFIQFIRQLRIQWIHTISAAVLSIGIISIQLTYWYLQTGDFVLYSYQGEGFDFTDPNFYNILFSFRKGLFIYTPVLLFGCLGVIYLFYTKRKFQALTWIGFFTLITFVLSSWWSWFYGMSFGNRAYIEFYPIFIIPFVIMLNEISVFKKMLIVSLAALCIPLNLIQDFQYTHYILDGYEMNFEKYKRVFLKTAPQYNGLVLKKTYDYASFDTIDSIHIGDVLLKPESFHAILRLNLDSLPDLVGTEIIHVEFNGSFPETMKSGFQMFVIDNNSKHEYFVFNPYALHFTERLDDQPHRAVYNFEMLESLSEKGRTIEFSTYSDKNGFEIRNMDITFLKSK